MIRTCIALLVLSLPQLFAQGGWPEPLSGQNPDSLALATAGAEQEALSTGETEGVVTPRGAFIRGMAFPGWGHAEVGSLSRGGFYFGVQAATGLMLFKTQTRLSRARDRLALLEAVQRVRLEAEGITDPLAVEAALSENPEVEDLRALEEVRADQREDWIALGLFMVLLSGVDAYVSAHLSQFPDPVAIGPADGGGVEVRVSLPLRR
jgi:hypothetical protein